MMAKILELEFYIRDNRGQTRPYDDTVCVILVPSDTSNSSSESLEKAINSMALPENVMLKIKHNKNVEMQPGSPFTVVEALLIKGYSYPNNRSEGENSKEIFFTTPDKDCLEGRSYLVGSTSDVLEIQRQIWTHFDIGLRFTLTESALLEQSLRRRMYGGF
ncbi:hypothetical protein ESCO47_00139 [Escherichia phage vB_EcoM_ESCO47]|nr:hypothetical protein ESCO47_00139 [Escherichia phage vB_EcoM_ESCO47]